MVKITSVTTRGGDTGKTSLGDGRRLSKHSLRIEAIGSVDEINSLIGLTLAVKPHATGQESLVYLSHDLQIIQNDLFDVGADLCQPDADKAALRMTNEQVHRLDEWVERYNNYLSPLTSFVLPGGTVLAAHLHVCRASVRRAERSIIALHQDETLNEHLIKYMNRLSDVLFVMARVANNNGHNDVLWVPGKFQTDPAV